MKNLKQLSIFAVLVLYLTAGFMNTLHADPKTIFSKQRARADIVEQSTKNILILGVDSRHGEKSRSDVMLLLNIKDDRINLISIPRDTLVELKGRGFQKINAAYAYGGIELSKKTVEQLLDVRIDNYMVVNFKAIEKGVDALGGFDVQIPKKIRICDPEFKKYYVLKEGRQTLNGVQTLGFLRYRSDGMGDIGRIGRQQKFLKDVQGNFLKLDNILVLPKAYNAIKNEIRTDMNFGDMMDYFIRGYELKDNVDYHMLRGYSKYINEVSYYIKDNQSLQALKQVIQ